MGQLFDPEWVQQNRPARCPLLIPDAAEIQRAVDAIAATLKAARRNAEAKAAAARAAATRAAAKAASDASRAAARARLRQRGYGAIVIEILRVLRGAPGGLTHGAMVKALGGVPVAGHLRIFFRRGLMMRSGERRAYTYTLSEQGCAYLAHASRRRARRDATRGPDAAARAGHHLRRTE